MSFRSWLSVITVAVIGLVVVLAWPEIRGAFQELRNVNLWILALMIPVQFVSYYASGEMLFSYLRAKGNIKDFSRLGATRLALEFNFVNHVFPSGGAAGMAYLAWQLDHHGVRPGRATMAQIVRFTLTFLSFVLLLIVALIILIIDHEVDRNAILLSLLLVVLAIGGTSFAVYIVSGRKRLTAFAGWLTRTVNRIVFKFTRGKNRDVVKQQVLTDFFVDIHEDYVAIKKDIRILGKPFVWAIVSNLFDVALLYIAFLSFGVHVNPAMLFIAFGLSSIGGAFAATPGGAGVYEAIMIAFLSSVGVPPHIAIAGTLLARIILMLGTIAFGYVFYQSTIFKYGKSPVKRQ